MKQRLRYRLVRWLIDRLDLKESTSIIFVIRDKWTVKKSVKPTNSHSVRDELCDIILDNQLDRARAFGQAHRRNRSK